MPFKKILCWEAFDATSELTRAAGRLYERTLSADERIPWAWIERSLAQRGETKPGGWSKHLLLAAPEDRADDPDALAGFAYGALIPGYGGYLCYVGVDERYRGQGVGTRLFDQFDKVLAVDAGAADEPLPFVVWESHRPGPDAPAGEQAMWQARVRLFDKVGGLWVKGVEFLSPNYADEDGPPVRLELFVKPVAVPAKAFDRDRVRELVAGLHQRVYRTQPGDPLFDATLKSRFRPELVPARLAAQPARPRVALR